MVVAAEVHGPRAGVAVGGEVAFDGVDKPVALAQREVQSCVHAGSAQHVVEDVERHAPFVLGRVGLTAYHDVGLMGVHVEGGGPTWLIPLGE